MGRGVGLPPYRWLSIGIPSDISDIDGSFWTSQARQSRGAAALCFWEEAAWDLCPSCNVLTGLPRNGHLGSAIAWTVAVALVDALLHLPEVENRRSGTADTGMQHLYALFCSVGMRIKAGDKAPELVLPSIDGTSSRCPQ